MKSDWKMGLFYFYWSKIFTTWFVTWSALRNFTMFPSNILCSCVTPRSIFIIIGITTIIMVFIFINQIINFVLIWFMRTIREPVLACVTTFGDIDGSFISCSIVSLYRDFQRKISKSWIFSFYSTLKDLDLVEYKMTLPYSKSHMYRNLECDNTPISPMDR